MANYSFRLILDRPMLSDDEDAFDRSPYFADGRVSLLLSSGQPTVLECDEIIESDENAAVADVTWRIRQVNNLRVVGRMPLEND